MAQIKSGKVNVQNGSSTVTGVDTEWLSDGVESTHEFTVAGDGVLYTIASVEGQEELTLSSPYAGETQDEVAYTIARDFTTPDSFPTMDFGDIETATIFTRAVRKIQSRFNSPSEVAALAAADIYTSTEDGISGTDSGDFFFVISEGSYTLYSNNSGSAVEEFTFTSQQELVDALNTVFDLRDETQGFRDEVQDNFESFFSKYLGAFETDPTEDRFGNPLQDGAIYFNTDENIIKFYADGDWLDAGAVAVSAAQDAQDSAEAAAQSESNASNSASAAAQSETNAATSETNAQASADAAATSESNASDSASAAATSESNASDSADAAATSESNAATSESNASDSADAAAQSETNASTSESNASDSEGLAQKWANEDRDVEVADGEFSAKHYSLVSQDEADRSDERADDSSFFADQSQSFMEDTEGFRNETEQFRDTTEQHKNDAEDARDDAQQALFDFNARYYGPLDENPTEDLNGDPPTVGDWYFNKPNNEVRIYTTNENWDVFSSPIESTVASEGEAVEGTDNVNYMTPLRTTNHFDARRQDVIDEAVDESETYTDGEIATLDSNLRSYTDTQADAAETNANQYTDNEVEDLEFRRELRERIERDATLNLKFAENRFSIYEGLADGNTEKPYADIVTHTRGSDGTGFNALRNLEVVTDDVQRLVYGPETGRSQGLLIEGEEVNQVEHSQELDAAYWGNNGNISVSLNTNGLNSSLQESLLTESASSEEAKAAGANKKLGLEGDPVTRWAIVKDVDARYVAIGVRSGSDMANSDSVVYDLETAEVVNRPSWFSAAEAVHLGNGYVLLSATVAESGSTTFTDRLSVGFASPDGTTVRYDSGSGGRQFIVAHVQAERSATRSSPIITTGTPATRAADVVSVGDVEKWYGETSGTFFADVSKLVTADEGRLNIFDTGSTSSTDIGLALAAAGFFIWIGDSDNRVLLTPEEVGFSSGDSFKICGTYDLANRTASLCINGVFAEGTLEDGIDLDVNSFRIGGYKGGSGVVHPVYQPAEILYVPYTLEESEMVAITQTGANE